MYPWSARHGSVSKVFVAGCSLGVGAIEMGIVLCA